MFIVAKMQSQLIAFRQIIVAFLLFFMADTRGSIIRCVLTGGPCGGKTTAINHLKEELTKKGFDVYTVPESATIMVLNGGVYPGLAPEKHAELVTFEDILVRFQIQLEDRMNEVAELQHQRTAIVLYDRGVMDIKAYVSTDVWNDLLRLNEVDEAAILSRYDLICHLVTAADGAEEYYTLSNNAARTEDASLARQIDQLTKDAWKDHQSLEIVTNHHGSFKGKLQALMEVVDGFIAKKTSVFNKLDL